MLTYDRTEASAFLEMPQQLLDFLQQIAHDPAAVRLKLVTSVAHWLQNIGQQAMVLLQLVQELFRRIVARHFVNSRFSTALRYITSRRTTPRRSHSRGEF